MVFIKGGCFAMGAIGNTFQVGESNEKPDHELYIDDFYMSNHEVTVGEFKQFVEETKYKTEAEKGDGCFYWTGKKWERDRSKNWKEHRI